MISYIHLSLDFDGALNKLLYYELQKKLLIKVCLVLYFMKYSLKNTKQQYKSAF